MANKLLVEFNECRAKFQNSDDFLEALGVDASKYMLNNGELCGIFGDIDLQGKLLKGKNLLDLLDEDFCRELLKKAGLGEVADHDRVAYMLASVEFAQFLLYDEVELCKLYDKLGFKLLDSERFEDATYILPFELSSLIFKDNWFNEKAFSTVSICDLNTMAKVCVNMLCYTPEKICDEHVDYVLEKVGRQEAESVFVSGNNYITKHGFSFKKYKVME